jgi:nicotinamide-nucleotide amidase
VRRALAVGGVGADVGVATTGVAGPEPHDGQPVGTVYIAVAMDDDVVGEPLLLSGSRSDIRAQTVELALQLLVRQLR